MQASMPGFRQERFGLSPAVEDRRSQQEKYLQQKWQDPGKPLPHRSHAARVLALKACCRNPLPTRLRVWCLQVGS